MTRRALLVVLLCALPASADDAKPLTRIAFACCSDQDKPLPIFDKIADLKPDLYLAMGDNIYVDLKREPGLDEMANMKAKYDRLAALPGWQRLTETCPMLATWDDHDYGKNDIGAEYAHKDESQQLHLDFFGVPKDSPRRTQKGVYNAKIIGPEGKRVQIILLDTRYFRSKLKKDTKPLPGTRLVPYVPNTDPGVTMLGAEQWTWLEEQLKQPAELRLIVSSIQLIADEHPHEKWANLPAERDRLYQLLRETKANGVVVLSGDRHLGEISMDPKAIGYPLFDVTSSGLNQGTKTWRAPTEPNRHRIAMMPHGDNFGLVTIDWSTADPKITVQVRDVDGEIALKESFPLSLLKPGPAVAELPHKPGEGAISPRDALKRVGQKVVVEMTVQATGQPKGGGRLFLNSEKDFRSELNFTVVLNAAAMKGKWAKATADTFKGKVIRVTGTVSEFRNNPQIQVDDEKQLELLGKTD
jgi:alkaline phosphatase D